MRHSFFALECFIFSYYVCIGSFQCGSSLCSFILLALYGLSLQGNQKPLHLKTPKLTRDVLLPHCLLPPQIAELGAELQELIYQGLNLEQIDLPHGPCRSKRHFVGVELLNLDNCPASPATGHHEARPIHADRHQSLGLGPVHSTTEQPVDHEKQEHIKQRTRLSANKEE